MVELGLFLSTHLWLCHIELPSFTSHASHVDCPATKPHLFPLQHRHHHPQHAHHHRKEDSLSSTSSASGISQSSQDRSFVNGDRVQPRRRGSQTSQTSLTQGYSRRESVEAPRRSLESPRPMQRSLALDLHRGSMDNISPGRRHDVYSRDDLSAYAHDPQGSVYPDVSQITAVQVTPRPKPRAFPRTNPAYVGVNRRDGIPSYKRINIETSAPPTAIYNQRFYDNHGQAGQSAYEHGGHQSASIQTTQTYSGEGGGDRHHLYRHERSDSDTSHSSYGRLPSDMTDSQISHYSGQTKHQRDHQSDSHSSQGSLRNLPDSHSSQGSLRSSHERDHLHDLSSSHSSPRHVNNNVELAQDTSSGVSSQRSLTRRNSEPDYANLPMVAHNKGSKPMTLDDPITRLEQEKLSHSIASGDDGADDLRSADSLSPAEYIRQDTPSSIRSHSTSHSHTSEGECVSSTGHHTPSNYTFINYTDT